MMDHPEINHYVDITDTFDQKLAALMSHTSQHRDPDGLRTGIRAHFAQVAADAGFPPNHYAEDFTVIRLG